MHNILSKTSVCSICLSDTLHYIYASFSFCITYNESHWIIPYTYMRLCSSAFPPMHSIYATRRRSSAMSHWVEFSCGFFPLVFPSNRCITSFARALFSSSFFVKSLHLVILRNIYYLWNIHRSSMLEIRMVKRIVSWKTQVYKNFPTGMISTQWPFVWCT